MLESKKIDKGHGVTLEVLREKEKFKHLTDNEIEHLVNQLGRLAEVTIQVLLNPQT